MGLGRDIHGRAILFADVPNAGVSRVNADTKSGNANHDVRSGKFGSGGPPKKKEPNPANANVDPAKLQAMLAAVRDAARKFPNLDQGDIESFLKDRAKDPAAVDIEKFLAMAKQQRLNDLSDLLDQELKSEEGESVQLAAPDGHIAAVLSSLEAEELAALVASLVARGNDEGEIKSLIAQKGEKVDPNVENRKE